MQSSEPVELNTIYNEDCLKTMKRMSNGAVDMVLTSPPYNMNLRVRNNEYVSRQIVQEFSTKYSGFSDNLPIEEFYATHHAILKELLRVSKTVLYNFQVVTGSKEAFFRIIGSYAEAIKDIIVWDKGEGQPSMAPQVMNASHELILVMEGSGKKGRQIQNATFERGTLSNIWREGRGGNGASDHGAVFPLSLAKKAILNFTDQSGVVYDPFMGTGTTARAAKDLGRHYIGSEISEEYCQIAEQRLKQETLL